MEPPPQPSFIPHDADTSGAVRRSEAGLGDLLLMIGVVVLVASAVLAGGVFMYRQFLSSTISSQLSQLKTARQQFDPNLVRQLTRLDDRMQTADALLAVHLAPSTFFAALNQVTAQTVEFTSLDMQVQDPHRIMLKMSGVAQSVNSIAFQADLLSKSGVFTSPIFSNLDRQKDGVHFNLTAIVDASKINFDDLAPSTSDATTNPPAAPATPATPATPFGSAPQQPAPQQ